MDRIRWKSIPRWWLAVAALAICLGVAAATVLASAYFTRGAKATLFIKNPSPAALPRFGVAVTTFGDDVLATGWLEGEGEEHGITKNSAVFLFDGKDGHLLLTIKDPGASPQCAFGTSLTVIGTKVVVGAPGEYGVSTPAGAVYVFELDRAYPDHARLEQTLKSPSSSEGDWFGQSLGVVQGMLAVGAPGADGLSGAVFLYDAETGKLLRTIRDREPRTPASFGYSLANVNGLLVVGAIDDQMGQGAAYIYDPQTGARTLALARPQQLYDSNFGAPLAVTRDKLIVGVPNDSRDFSNPLSKPIAYSSHGSAYVFDLATGASLFMLRSPSPYDGARFGSATASLGDRVFVSAPGYRMLTKQDWLWCSEFVGGWPFKPCPPGAVYVFGPTGGRPLHTIRAPQPKPNDEFGRVVVPWGENLLIVGRDSASNADAIYVCRNAGR